MKDGEVVEDTEDEEETDAKTCCGCRQTEEQQTEHVVVITASKEDLNGSEKVPLEALEVETVEDHADTSDLTSVNTKEEHTAVVPAGQETEGKSEL